MRGDQVVRCRRRQTRVSERRVRTRELQVAVRYSIDTGERRPVERERERSVTAFEQSSQLLPVTSVVPGTTVLPVEVVLDSQAYMLPLPSLLASPVFPSTLPSVFRMLRLSNRRSGTTGQGHSLSADTSSFVPTSYIPPQSRRQDSATLLQSSISQPCCPRTTARQV